MDPFTYQGSSAFSLKKIQKQLPKTTGYHLVKDSGPWITYGLRDTATDALLGNSLLLLEGKKELLLLNLKDGSMTCQKAASGWQLAQDLPMGPVAKIIKPLCKLRALLLLGEIEMRLDTGRLLDDEEKTRARFYNYLFRTGDGREAMLGTTRYLRGYGQAHLDLVDALKTVTSAGKEKQFYLLLGLRQTSYDPKPKLALDPDASAKNTATRIIKTFIDVARTNEAGIIADYDTEFLHDFRVGFRKVRSVLSLFKNVYPPKETRHLKTAFAELMQSTNRLRDLDVYLLEKKNYLAMVPEPSKEGVKILFTYLEKLREKEWKKTVKTLKSKNYQRQVGELAALFQKNKKLKNGCKGDLPALEYGSRLIAKRYGEVCRIARTIDPYTPDERVHELRISCKKLRYLMEFFAPLYPGEAILSLIKSLKILQDNLGRFNDYSVQQDFLRQIMAEDSKAFAGDQLAVTESVGALTAMLYGMQTKEKKQVMKNFARFDSSETRSLFNELFAAKGAK